MAMGKRCCLAAQVPSNSPSVLATIASVASASVSVPATASVDKELWLVDSDEARARGFTEQDHHGSTKALMKRLVVHCAPHGHDDGAKKSFMEELLSLDSTHIIVEVLIHICIHGVIEAIFHYLHMLAHRRSKAKAKARKAERALNKDQNADDQTSSSSSSSCEGGVHHHTVSH